MTLQLSPKIQEAINNVQLLQGEQIDYAIQADGFFLGTNPAAKAIAKIQAFMTKLTGGHIRIFLVLTNKRVILVESTAKMCGCTATKNVHTIGIKSIVEAGSAKETQMCCFHTRMIHIESFTQKYSMVVKQFSDQELREFISRMSMLILMNPAI
ncbi:MAG: hypothetical protein JXR95_00790 [Deltaproteobacteria bacterium]|nr:hypothetical protein [Deltaproteobacteria bacterium]